MTLRQRTTSTGNDSPYSPVPGIASASPPRFVLLEEVMGATRGITNMAIAHEIAVDSDFKLEKLHFPQNRYWKLEFFHCLGANGIAVLAFTFAWLFLLSFSLEKQVKDVVHQAFWDLLAENLKQNPQNFDQALSLLTDIKMVEYFYCYHLSEIVMHIYIATKNLPIILKFRHWCRCYCQDTQS